MKRIALCFAVVILLCSSGMTATAKIDMNALPRKEYIVKHAPPLLDKALVEGENKVIFAVTPEERAKYIPTTIWREVEQAAAEEECMFSLVSTQGVDAEETARFLRGESEALRLPAGASILVELSGPHWLTEVGLDATGEAVVTITDETMKKNYERIAVVESNVYSFAPLLLCTYLMIGAPETGGEACLQGLLVKGRPALGTQLFRAAGENPIVLGARDASNPLSVRRIPLRQGHYRLAEQLLAGRGNLSGHQKIMVFMDYISDFYIGLDGRHGMDTCMRSYVGDCGNYTHLLAALARTQGIPARIIEMPNYPQNTGHVVCELFYDRGWHLYDPTFGAYYTTSPEDTVYPTVLSFDELTQGKGDITATTCIVTSPHRLTGRMSYGFLGPRIYQEANPKGVIAPEHPMVYPLSMHFDGVRTLLTQVDFSNKYQGINYIGAASINNMHKWRLSGLEAGKRYEFIVTASGVYGEKSQEPFMAKAASEDARLEEGMKHCFVNADTDSMQWRISFVPDTDAAHILLTHDERGPDFHYVGFSSFGLRKMN